MNRYVPRGVLKKSAYYATRGAEYRGQLVPFGETVMAHWITRANQKAWVRGTFVGKHETDDTNLVATDLGVISCRTIRRLTDEQCWEKQVLIAGGGSPWKMATDAHGRGLANQRPQPHTIPIAVSADIGTVEPSSQRAPVPELSTSGGGAVVKAERSGEPRSDVASGRDDDCDSSSSSSSAASRSPRRSRGKTSSSTTLRPSAASPAAAAAEDPMEDSTALRRMREEGNDSDEDERLRAAALTIGALTGDGQVRHKAYGEVVAGLSSPHEESDFLYPITEDERVVAHDKEIEMLRSFEVFEEIDEEQLEQKPNVITTTWVDRRKNA